MPQFQLKNPEVIEAYPLPDGSYTIIKDGKGSTPISKAEFEGKYTPFVKTG